MDKKKAEDYLNKLEMRLGQAKSECRLLAGELGGWNVLVLPVCDKIDELLLTKLPTIKKELTMIP